MLMKRKKESDGEAKKEQRVWEEGIYFIVLRAGFKSESLIFSSRLN
jgi:hypothetical protein